MSATPAKMPSMLAHAHPELKDAAYVVFVDANRRYVDCSEGACELLGYTREEMLQKKIEDISYDFSLVSKLFAQYVESRKQEGEYVLQRKNRTPLPIRKGICTSPGTATAPAITISSCGASHAMGHWDRWNK